MAMEPPTEEVAIGVIGAEAFVHRIAELAREDPAPIRLLTAAYERPVDAGERAAKLIGDVDVLLFAGPLPHDAATKSQHFTVPATHVPIGGTVLPSTLLKGVLSGGLDPSRISIDSVSEREVAELYAQLDLPIDQVRVRPYNSEATPEEFLAFHRDLHAAGHTSGALTTVPTVADELRAEGIECLMMEPSQLTLRNSLRTARLLGSGARLEDSRIAIVIVSLPTDALPQRIGSSNYWYQELRLSLHRALLHDARRMDAAILQRDERSYLVVTTMGSLRQATDDLARAPFLGAINESLSVDVAVGIGLGRTTLEAEGNAQTAVELADREAQEVAYLIGPQRTRLALPASADAVAPTATPAADPQAEVLRAILGQLDEGRDADRVVDAERIAQLQGVTLRTARRTLRSLVDAGLAWPMPPARSQKAGRPPVRYQLLDERV